MHRATTRVRADAQLRAGGARAGSPAGRARRRSALRPPKTTATASGRSAARASKSSCACAAEPRPRRFRSRRGAAPRLASVSTGSAESGAFGFADAPSSSRSNEAEQPLDRAVVEQVGVVLPVRRRGRSRPRPASGSGRTSPSPRRRRGPGHERRPGSAPRPRHVLQDRTSPGRAASGDRLRAGASSSTSFSNGRSWWRRRASVVSPHPLQDARRTTDRPRGRSAAPAC